MAPGSRVVVLTARAIAVSEGRERGIPSMRLRSRYGRWLVLHASRLPGAVPASDVIVMVIEPASSFEIAPIIVEAHGLTAREQEITLALARGLSTIDVAGELFLSAHTVRDHIKSIFAKLAVSSPANSSPRSSPTTTGPRCTGSTRTPTPIRLPAGPRITASARPSTGRRRGLHRRGSLSAGLPRTATALRKEGA